MRLFAAALVLSVSAAAQMEMPPGTTSPVVSHQAAPDATQTSLATAEDAIASGKYAEAVALLAPLATPAQKNGRIFYDLGFAQDALHQDAEAVAAYTKAIALEPNDAAAAVSLGLLQARTGNVAGAEEHLTAATKLADADHALLARAYRALSAIHLKTAPDKARADLISALRYSPETSADAETAAEISDALHDDEATEQAYAHAFQIDPSSIDAATGYARTLTRATKYPRAEEVLQAALKEHPGNHALLAELASTQLLQGNAKAALPSLAALHKDEPENTAVTLLLARAYGASGEPDMAQPIYTALLKQTPDDVTLMAQAADNLIRLHRSAEAEPLLHQALAHPANFPSQSALADAAGELAFAASSNKDAETVLKALALRETISPLTAPFTFLSATAHDTLHHTKQAADAYRLFVTQSAGRFPDQEWQAQQRLRILDRGK